MVSLRRSTWVGVAAFVLVAVGVGLLVAGAPIIGIGFCVLAVGLAGVNRRTDEAA